VAFYYKIPSLGISTIDVDERARASTPGASGSIERL